MANNKPTSFNFRLDGGLNLQVNLWSGKPLRVELKVPNNGPSSLVLHWGVLHSSTDKTWKIPSHFPPGTSKYRSEALQTAFQKSGSSSFLTIAIWDSKISAIEFVLKDKATSKWFKLNGTNVHVNLPRVNVEIPEELIKVQAYLRWEKNGRQNYTLEKQKKEFEEAKKDLLLELSKGITLDDLHKKLKAGQTEKTIDSGQSKMQVSKQKFHKKWETSYLLNKYSDETNVKDFPEKLKDLNPLLLAVQKFENSEGTSLFQKNIFNIGGKMLVVIVQKDVKTTKVVFITDMTDSVVLHWGLSLHSSHEWLVPPIRVRPKLSSGVGGACETQFEKGFSGFDSFKFVQINLGEENFIGIPFVLRARGHWIKNGSSDFYVSLQIKQEKSFQGVNNNSIVRWLLDKIAEQEVEAERSLMHRYNIATELTEKAQGEGKLGLAGILVWMRFMATRKLTWNKNYNVKPREISTAQEKFTNLLQRIYQSQPYNREMIRLIMSTVGRGGQGDVGQRIRDDILVIQQNNDCKGGMMEEWHQKLHNNTNPDDVVICQALLNYIKSGYKLEAYWKALNENGVTKERLRSYDRPIISEPSFRSNQKEGLIRDLMAYLKTLKAVHSGADLESAIAICVGHDLQGNEFMGGMRLSPIRGLSNELKRLLKFVMEHIEDNDTCLLLGALVDSRLELRSLLLEPHERLKDIIFLDLAIDSAVRTTAERGYEKLKITSPEDFIHMIILVLQNLTLSSDDNEDLVFCLKDWYRSYEQCSANNLQWALYSKAVLDRTGLVLADHADYYNETLQPSAQYLGVKLRIDQETIGIFTEEIIRAGTAASLSQLINHFNPVLRRMGNLGEWQIISPVEVSGFVTVVNELLEVQDKSYNRPTIIVANRVKGEEEIPNGAVAILTTDMPDVLSHVSVRARTCKVCFATCYDNKRFDDIRSYEGKAILLRPTGSDIKYLELKTSDFLSGNGNLLPSADKMPRLSLKKKKFSGKYAVSASEFTSELVGSKSCNIAYLRQKVPSWIKVPTSVALTFGVFEVVLGNTMNKEVANKILSINKHIMMGDFSKLKDIRETVLQLKAPVELANELKRKMQISGMPWPGEIEELKWQQAWMAIKKVWASKWNERAYFSTQKVRADHNDLCMAVLVQEIISADYAFVIHTTNPLSRNTSEIYAEIVKGLGETLVGAYPGRAMSFVTRKSALQDPKIVGYPSKKIGLFIGKSLIFRSDSNGEDLEGFAGAGLYDSVPMDPEEKRLIDYSTDKLVIDSQFQLSILSKIAKAGVAIEEIYNAPQDIEGVVKDAQIFIVQTRPQM